MNRASLAALLVGLAVAGAAAWFLSSSGSNAPSAPPPAESAGAPATKKPAALPSKPREAEPSIATTESEAPMVPAKLQPNPKGSIVGRVLDDTGAPLADASVSLYAGKTDEGATPIATTRTDETGRFLFAGRESAEGLALTIDAHDFLPDKVASLAVRAGVATDAGDRRLRPGGRLSGTVVDEDGAPVAGAEVRTWGFVSMPADAPPHVTDAQGKFRIGGLLASTYGLRVDAKGFAPGSLDEIAVKLDQEVANLRVALKRGLTITGHVMGSDGSPIAGARVAFASDGPFVLQQANERGAVETDAGGRFELSDAPATSGRVTASAKGWADASATAAGGAGDVTITLTRPGSIHGTVVDARTGSPLASFTAWAEAEENGRVFVIGGARVSHDHETTVDGSSDGTFTIDGLAPGSYVVHAVAKGFAENKSDSIAVTPAPDVAETQLALVRGGSIRGVIVEEGTNHPIAGATVSASIAGKSRFGDVDSDNVAILVSGPGGRDMEDFVGSTQASTKTGDDGKFELVDLPEAKYRLRAKHPDHATAEQAGVSVTAGEATGPLTLTLGAAGSIEGLVTDVQRAPLEGARVTARTAKGFSRSATTGDDGRYSMRNLPPGTYFVQRDPDGPSMAFMAVTMVAGGDGSGGSGPKPPGVEAKVLADQVARVDFSDADLGAVEGRVLDDGKPVEGATVELRTDGPFSMPKNARTDADGRYDFDRLEPGAFVLAVQMAPEARDLVAEHVPIAAGRRLEKDLPLPAGTIEGVVVDRLSHRGIEGAIVRAEAQQPDDGGSRFVIRRGGPATPAGITTDRDGKFRVPYLAPGKYRITAAKEDFGQESKDAIEISKTDVHVTGTEIQLGSSGTLVGRVVDAETGAPISRANVQGHDSSGSPLILSDTVETDSDGRFRIGGVRPGSCSLMVFAMGYAPWRGDASVETRGESPVSVALQKNR
jgi:protocatechuate 3,4-dioxygenase beta subunit